MSKIEQIVSLLDQLLEDTSVPKNVRASVAKAKDRLLKEGGSEGDAGVASAIYALEEISNDINLPMHARTMVWNILSELESMKS